MPPVTGLGLGRAARAIRIRAPARPLLSPGEDGVAPARRSREQLLRSYAENHDEKTREELVSEFMPLARKLASRYLRTSEPREDLLQVASLGLLKAIDRFDPDRGFSFSSFAVPTILGELRRHFRDTTWAVHVPRRSQERMQAIDSAIERLTVDLQRSPTVEEIAGHLNIGVEDVLDGMLVRHAYDADPLERPDSGDEDGSPMSAIDSFGARDPGYERVEKSVTIARGLTGLSEDERRILHLRFVEEMTQSQIATEVGVSQMQVSRILATTIDGIRKRSGLPPGEKTRRPRSSGEDQR
ncbi:MAG TPA: SigB/SigF/SigG family RNA polymerase sigma factor [Solirubrobacteraceae bacterium]|nr:SigB/SigF/SigG family RNA polymerase sigma factor [Solirubrobacteraceae bacterium]